MYKIYFIFILAVKTEYNILMQYIDLYSLSREYIFLQ